MKKSCLMGFLAACLPWSLPAAGAPAPKEAPAWKAGAASLDITPEEPSWMAGYGGRKKPSEGVAQHVFAKALAIEDAAGARMVFVTLDLVGVPRAVREGVERLARERHGFTPETILLNASHTHSGPALSRGDVGDYRGGVADATYAAKADAYGAALPEKIVRLIGDALARSGPATLHYTHARAGFAMNRRLRVGNETQIRNSPNPDGPVDHDVPVLRVTGADGSLKALLFGYACHNTTSGTYLINGDYAGHAQAILEETRPGVVALFMLGCGGDQNPYPRGTLEQAAQHGRTLANAVEAALAVVTQRPLHGPLRSAFGHAELDIVDTGRADLERRARSRSKDEKSRAEDLLKQLEAKGALPGSYPCPVQVVQFGTDLTLVAIGGETTVDYSLRLKREMASIPSALWVAGYSNDVFGYLGSRRVIVEGGYEGYSANMWDFPGPWGTNSEERVIGKAYDLIRSINH